MLSYFIFYDEGSNPSFSNKVPLFKSMSFSKLILKSQRIKKKHKIKTYLLNKCPQRKVTCLKVTFMAPKKPNSATYKVVKVLFFLMVQIFFINWND